MGCANATQAGGNDYTVSVVKLDDPEFLKRIAFNNRDEALEAVSGMDPKVPFHKRQLILSALGRGAFARVYAAHRFAQDSNGTESGGEGVAVKVTDLRTTHHTNIPLLDMRMRRCAEKEADILSRVSGQRCCVAYFDHYIEGRFAYLVMEKCDLTLQQVFERCDSINERVLAQTFNDMLQALVGIHGMGIVHRDVMPDNFLYSGTMHNGMVKLCDFGLADAVGQHRSDLKDVFGTAPYMSPEMLEGKGYGTKTDVWSFAVIAYVLLFGHFPYTPSDKSSKAMKEAILVGVPDPRFKPKPGVLKGSDIVSDGALKFVRNVFDRDDAQRTTAEKALQDPWLKAMTAGPHGLAVASTDTDMVNFKPLIQSARRVGAFAPRSSNYGTCSMDIELAALQTKYHDNAIRFGKPRNQDRPDSSVIKDASKSTDYSMEGQGSPRSPSKPQSLSSASTITPSSGTSLSMARDKSHTRLQVASSPPMKPAGQASCQQQNLGSMEITFYV